MSRKKTLDSLVEDRLRALLASTAEPSDLTLKLIDSATGFLKSRAKGKQESGNQDFWRYLKSGNGDEDGDVGVNREVTVKHEYSDE